MSDPDTGEEPRVVIRDKRRIDPETGDLREAPGEQSPAADEAMGAPGPILDGANEAEAALRTQLDERVADLQRVSAEYANYRRRVERDRVGIGEQATGAALAALLPVLDDIDRARAHGDLSGPFQTVAESLESAVAKLGLVAFGSPGDVFDPNRHEAVMHETRDDVAEATCVQVMRRGYLLGEKLLRAAMVGVAEPSGAAPATSADDTEQPRFDERA